MANVLKIPLADVQHLIQSNAHKRFVYLARKVEDDNAAYISKLHLTGVSTEQDFSRFYPMGEDAAGLIGIVGGTIKGWRVSSWASTRCCRAKTACGSIRRTAAAR